MFTVCVCDIVCNCENCIQFLIKNVTEHNYSQIFSHSKLNYPERIFNIDEICFYLYPKGELILGPCRSNVCDKKINSNKQNTTTTFAANTL